MEEEFKCGSQECVPSTAKCNGFNDCKDGSDELDNCAGNNKQRIFLKIITNMLSGYRN